MEIKQPVINWCRHIYIQSREMVQIFIFKCIIYSHGCEHSSIYLKHNNCHYEVVVVERPRMVIVRPSVNHHFKIHCLIASNVSSNSCEDHSEKFTTAIVPSSKRKKNKPKKRSHEDETYISIMKSITKKSKKNEQHKGK